MRRFSPRGILLQALVFAGGHRDANGDWREQATSRT